MFLNIYSIKIVIAKILLNNHCKIEIFLLILKTKKEFFVRMLSIIKLKVAKNRKACKKSRRGKENYHINPNFVSRFSPPLEEKGLYNRNKDFQ